ncbi:MAG: phage holin family protein [Candidatus Dormibacteraeota bacterium]|nr:phage holin family protein [Candidatus Dormibacteraeota bacterium]
MPADSSVTPAAGDKPKRPPLELPVDRTQAGTTDLARGLVDDAQKLVELQLQLAKTELRGLAIRNGIAIGLLAFAALLLVFAIFAGVPLIVVEVVPNHILTAIIFAAAYAFVAIILAVVGRYTLKLKPPQRTIDALKETKEWLVRQISTSR